MLEYACFITNTSRGLSQSNVACIIYLGLGRILLRVDFPVTFQDDFKKEIKRDTEGQTARESKRSNKSLSMRKGPLDCRFSRHLDQWRPLASTTPDKAHESTLLTQPKHTSMSYGSHQNSLKCIYTYFSFKWQVNTHAGALTLADDVEIKMKRCERGRVSVYHST